MNFEKPKKKEPCKKEKKKKKTPGDIIISQVYQKPQSHEVQFLRYRVRQIFFCHFGSFFALLPLTLLATQKTKILKKGKQHLKMSSF